MPFQLLPEKNVEKPNSSDFGLFIVRFISSAAFAYYQLMDQLIQAKLFIWDKAEWELINQVSDLGLPFPSLVAIATVLLFTISLLSISVGIFTRINSLVLFVLAAFILIAPIQLAPTLTPQTLVLYLALFLALVCGGAGRVSLDYLLTRKKKEKK